MVWLRKLKSWFYAHCPHKHNFSDYSEYGEKYPTCTKCGIVSFWNTHKGENND